MLFFSLSHAYPRVLHSFPTRRSSDLHPHRLLERATHDLDADLLVVVGDLHLVQSLLGEQQRHAAARHDALLDRGAGDRKSTRLNSSHTVISYAVFCLKKKNKTTNKTT